MGLKYADRIFLSMNGVEFEDVESVTFKQSDGTKAVPTMSRNRRNKGAVSGNREISFSTVIAVQNKLGSPKVENIDFEANSVQCTIECGADRYTLVDVFFVDADQSASGVGSEAKKTVNLIAMDVIDQVGNSALFPTSLTGFTTAA